MTFDERFRALVGAFECSVTSGKRGYKRNLAVGGTSNSLHLADLARDVVLENRSQDLKAFLEMAKRLKLWTLDEGDHIHAQEII